MKESVLFGQGIGFPPRIEDGRWAWSAGPQNIREAIKIILLTEPEERLMLPDFGGGLRRFLFEPNTVTTHRLVQQHITESLEQWEARIHLNAVTVEPSGTDPQEAVITIEYELVTTGEEERLSLTIKLAG